MFAYAKLVFKNELILYMLLNKNGLFVLNKLALMIGKNALLMMSPVSPVCEDAVCVARGPFILE